MPLDGGRTAVMSCLKILFVHGIGEIGGAERELLLYMDHLRPRGYEPTVICPEGGPLRGELAAKGIASYGAAFPPWRKLAGIWKRFPSVWSLRTLLEELRPDLIHVNEFWWVPQTLRAMSRAMRDNTPVVAHFRQDLPAEKVRQYELGWVDEVCAVSNRVATTLRSAGVEEARLHVLHSGLDVSWFEPSSGRTREEVRRELGLREHDLAVLTAAHVFERKGYHVALSALHAVCRVHPDTHYIVVGTGDAAYEARLRAQCRQLGLEARVRFVGYRSDVRTYLEAADLYLQPSLMEGFGIAVLEAMACGRAVVASDTGGIPDMVVDGETGALVAPGNASDLARAILGLLADGRRRTAMGDAGRRRAWERFSVARMMDGLAAVYEAACRGRAAHPAVTT